MPEAEQFQAERAEFKAVLGSGILNRSPHLVQFLTYVCERYFEGRASQIKEYTIGVEAFGRSAGFDPKKDSIVRVEAHRLRKRLEEYYALDGAQHRIRIVIPCGQYTPRFIDSSSSEVQTQPLSGTNRSRSKKIWLVAVPVLLACVLAIVVMSSSALIVRGHASGSPDEVWTGPSNPVPAEFRMLAGYHGRSITDLQGHTWGPDAYYTGGRSISIPRGRIIECESDDNLLRTERMGQFSYAIPLSSGTYELHLYFAETEYGPGNPLGGGEGSRVLQVSMNGVPIFTSLDVLAEAGAPNRLDERVLKDVSPAADGKLHLDFRGINGSATPAILSAIEILPAVPGRIRPVRIVAQKHPLIDSQGLIWSADEFFLGGIQVLRHSTILDQRGEALYRGERYGDFSYRIPLAPGKYRLTLHFAETWFGSPESHQPALGSRVFNVFANGVALLNNFEIAREAGRDRALTKVFQNLEPDAEGVLSLEFVPVKNYAEVNAIEVVETE